MAHDTELLKNHPQHSEKHLIDQARLHIARQMHDTNRKEYTDAFNANINKRDGWYTAMYATKPRGRGRGGGRGSDEGKPKGDEGGGKCWVCRSTPCAHLLPPSLAIQWV